MCLHGFTDTWRTWELVLPELERHHDVLALTLPGHAGGPPIAGEVDDALVPDAIERAMDAAGWDTAHLVGNSLGGYVALQLAARGRAEVGRGARPGRRLGRGRRLLAGDARSSRRLHEGQAAAAAPHAGAIVATPEGRRRATQLITDELRAHPRRAARPPDARRRAATRAGP